MESWTNHYTHRSHVFLLEEEVRLREFPVFTLMSLIHGISKPGRHLACTCPFPSFVPLDSLQNSSISQHDAKTLPQFSDSSPQTAPREKEKFSTHSININKGLSFHQSWSLETLTQEWKKLRLLLSRGLILILNNSIMDWRSHWVKEQKDTRCYWNTLHLPSSIMSIRIRKHNLSDEKFLQAQHFLAPASLSVPTSSSAPPCSVSSDHPECLEVPQPYHTFHPLFPQLPIAGMFTVFTTQSKWYLLREAFSTWPNTSKTGVHAHTPAHTFPVIFSLSLPPSLITYH